MDPVIGLGSLTQQSVTPTAQTLGSLDQNAFMNLMMAQLRYQDPLAPSDSNAMMEQTSMLAQTELMTKLASQQQQLLGLQQTTMAADLIGTQVVGMDAQGGQVTGVVEAVRFAETGPLLVIGDALVPLESAIQFGPSAGDVVSDPVDAPLTTPATGTAVPDDPVAAPYVELPAADGADSTTGTGADPVPTPTDSATP